MNVSSKHNQQSSKNYLIYACCCCYCCNSRGVINHFFPSSLKLFFFLFFPFVFHFLPKIIWMRSCGKLCVLYFFFIAFVFRLITKAEETTWSIFKLFVAKYIKRFFAPSTNRNVETEIESEMEIRIKGQMYTHFPFFASSRFCYNQFQASMFI